MATKHKNIIKYNTDNMKKIFSLMTLLSLLSISSCDKEENPVSVESGVTFSFSDVNVTASSFDITITPSDLETNYFVYIAESSEFAGKDGETIISEMLGAHGTKMYSGVQTISKQNLKAATNYSIAAFAYGEKKNVSFFHLATREKGEVDFSVSINVSGITAKSATVKIVPSDDSVNYFARVITKMEIQTTDGSDLDIAKYCLENPYYEEYIRTGSVEYDYTVSPKMDYVVVAFNYDNIEDVANGLIPIELFKYEFSTPDTQQVDPDTMFTFSNLEVGYTDFSVDVTPVYGEDSFWSYYIFTKASYQEELDRNYNQVVRHAYYGLQGLLNEYNVANEPNIDFSTFIQDYMGVTGTATLTSYETLRPDTDYVLVLFYMDPNVIDPTVVYDYAYVPIEFRTLTSDEKPYLAVDGPYIEDETILFNIKIDETAVKLVYGPAAWSDTVATYYDENDPYNGDAIRAFVNRVTANDEVFAKAQSAEGVTISFDATGGFDGLFLFEAENAYGRRSQYVVRVTPDMF